MPITLLPTGSVSADITGPTVDLGSDARIARLVLEVSSSGATLDGFIDTSPSGQAWVQVAAFEQVTEPGFQRLDVHRLERFIRFRAVVDGSFTVSVSGETPIAYAAAPNFTGLSLPDDVSKHMTPTNVVEALLTATGEIDTAAEAAGYPVPLSNWAYDVRGACSKLAAYHAVVMTGYRPTTHDVELRTRYEDAVQWLDRLREGDISLLGIELPGEGSDDELGAGVASLPSRGWLS